MTAMLPTVAQAAKQCMPCPAGTYSDAGTGGGCKPCPAGTYQNQTGQVGCIACPAGYYCPQEESKVATPCIMPMAHVCPVGSTSDKTGSICAMNKPMNIAEANKCLNGAIGYIWEIVTSNPIPPGVYRADYHKNINDINSQVFAIDHSMGYWYEAGRLYSNDGWRTEDIPGNGYAIHTPGVSIINGVGNGIDLSRTDYTLYRYRL
ncbi:MAG: hypothetical protein LBI17_00305 [Rickettsiales bacterium]|nr:hypothetical protein [Rickettsiales bacterium]